MYTLARIHRFDSFDQQLAIAFDVFDEYEEQFERRFGHQTVFTRNQRVEPLDSRVVLHDAIHSVDIEHHLTQSCLVTDKNNNTKKVNLVASN